MRTTEKFRINRVLLIAGFILLCNSNFADASAVIKGRVTDIKKQPINYATATLLNPNTMEIVEGDMCNNKGEFVIENVKPGEYILSVRMLGYAKDESEKIIVDQSKDLKVEKNIVLNQSMQQLNEVVVTAKRPLKQQTAENISKIKSKETFVDNRNISQKNNQSNITANDDNSILSLKVQLATFVKELQAKNNDYLEKTTYYIDGLLANKYQDLIKSVLQIQ